MPIAIRASLVAWLFALLVPLGPAPAFAQNEEASAEQRLAEVDRDEAVEIMRTAILHVEGSLNTGGQPLDPEGHYPGKRIAVNTTGMLSGDFSRQGKEALAERLAGALGIERAERRNAPGLYVTASLPEIDGAEAHVRVSREMAFEGGRFGRRVQELKLERTPGGEWNVVELLSLMFVDGMYGGAETSAPDTTGVIPVAVVEHKPTLVGGEEALYEALQYPDSAKRANVEGAVYMQFVVGLDGQTRDFAVLRSPHETLTKEAERVLREMRFEPGKKEGEAVPTRMSMPVRFEL